MIRYNEQLKKFEGLVDGRVVSRAATKDKVEKTLRDKYGVTEFSGGSAVVEVPKSEFTVAERFEFIAEFTRLVARGVIPSLVVTGSGGLGKSHTVTETLIGMGKKEDAIGEIDGDFIVIKGYATARSIYEMLYDNNGKILIFDDCDDAFKDPTAAQLFKAALDSGDKRIISWGVSGSKDGAYPSRFEFIGKVIFISNLSISKFPQAILSRSMLADITLNTEEKIERIEQVFGFEKAFDKSDKKEVVRFIRENADKFKDLNIRSAFNALKMKVAIGEGWERMALYSATLN